MKKILMASLALAVFAGVANAQVGFVDFDGTTTGLIGYTNSAIVGNGTTNGNMSSTWTYATYASSGDAFNPMSRSSLAPMETDAGQIGMAFAISDDSVVAALGNSVFAADVQGFAGSAKTDGFFGVTDTVNTGSPGTETAVFSFNILGALGLGASIDFAAMGDFETADVFNFEYQIDGGGYAPLFTSIVDETATQVYTMDNVANNPVNIDDPMTMNGVYLDDNFQTISAAILGTGAQLDIRFTASADGGTEAFGFDNLRVTPEPATLGLLALGGLAVIRRRRA